MDAYIPSLRFHGLTPLYDSAVRWTANERAFRKSMLEEMRASRPPRELLDIGCGTGSYAALLKQEFPAARVVGIDADEQALAIARRKAARLRLDIEFHCADARRLTLPDASFDAASASLFFHHLEDGDKLAVMRQIYRCLRPEGRLIVADWHRPVSLAGRMRFALVRGLDGFAVTRTHASGGFPALLAAAGFDVPPDPSLPPPWARLQSGSALAAEQGEALVVVTFLQGDLAS